MKITVCIGSSCHLKGSRQVVEKLQELIAIGNHKDQLELGGTFCLGNCQSGVCVMFNEKTYSLTPDTTEDFFENDVLKHLNS